jgi:methyl-accepting chemotaxis protein
MIVPSRFSTSNWPFAVKFAVPCLLAFVLVIIIEIMATGTINNLETNLQSIVENKFNASVLLANSIEQLRAANGNLYQVQMKQAAGIKQDTVDETKKITVSLDKISENLAKFKKEYASAEDGKKIDAAIANVKTYKDAVSFVGSMLDVDFKATVNFVVPLAKTYDEMIEDLSVISDKFLTDSRLQSQQAVKDVASQKRNLYMASITILLITILMAVGIAISTIRSVRRVAEATHSLADGDANIDVDGLARSDELGQIVKALSVFRNNIMKVKALEAEQKNREQETAVERKKALHQMANDFEESLGQIVNSVASASTELHANAESLSGFADQTNRESATVAEATQQASLSVQTVAAAAEELSASIQEITRQVGESTRMATVAVDQVKQTNTTVSTLSSAATEIGDVVSLIRNIAQQTNLLALNATIEAARAGEAGKGFAVVASEVKNLASQTARATEDITQKIDTIQQVSTEAVDAIRSIGKTIDETSAIAGTIATAIQQQAEATREISKNVQQASVSTSAVSGCIASVTQASTESQTAAAQVLSAAADLSVQAEKLNHKIGVFMSKVRAD